MGFIFLVVAGLKENCFKRSFFGFRDLHKIIATKNIAAGIARRNIFGFYIVYCVP
jgi:hypothetical protein